MVRAIISFLALNTISVYLVSQLLDGFIITGGVWGFVLVGTIIGILNVFVKPILKVLSLPFIFLTVGFFLLIINALILWMAEGAVVFLNFEGITFIIEGIGTYLVSVIILGFVNYLFQKLI